MHFSNQIVIWVLFSCVAKPAYHIFQERATIANGNDCYTFVRQETVTRSRRTRFFTTESRSYATLKVAVRATAWRFDISLAFGID